MPQMEFLNAAGKKERGARQIYERLLYCVNVNRTSLDHLLLGERADIDRRRMARVYREA